MSAGLRTIRADPEGDPGAETGLLGRRTPST